VIPTLSRSNQEYTFQVAISRTYREKKLMKAALLAVATIATATEFSSSVSSSCGHCYTPGTMACNGGVCSCKSGFIGSRCNTCDNGHFGDHCSPIGGCCFNQMQYSHLLLAEEDDHKKGYHRSRRQVHIQQNCDYRAELCEVEDALAAMYDAISLTPPVDDLEPYLKDVHKLQESLLALQLKIQTHMQSGLDGSHDQFLDEINEELNKTHFALSKLDGDAEEQKEAIDTLMSLDIMNEDQSAFEELREKLTNELDMDEIDNLITSIRDSGSELERNYGVPLFNDIANLNLKETEFKSYADSLTIKLGEMHQNWTSVKDELTKCTSDDCRPASEIAAELTKIVTELQQKLPHGWPTIFSWFDDAAEVQEIMEKSKKNMDETLATLKQKFDELQKDVIDRQERYSETLDEWEAKYIDVRNLVIYIEFLEALARYPDNPDLAPPLQNPEDIDMLMELLLNITATYEEAKEIADFEPVREVHEEAKRVAVKANANAIETRETVADYTKTMGEIDETDLVNLENALNQADLVQRAENANQGANQAAQQVTEALQSLDDLLKGKRRKKRKVKRELERRKRRRQRRKRKRSRRDLDAEFDNKMERIGKLTENVAQLMLDVRGYREATDQDGQTYKRYVDTVAGAQDDIELFGEELSKACPGCHIGPDVTYEDVEKNVTDSIALLKEHIRETTARIFSKSGC